MNHVIVTDIERADADVVEALGRHGASTVHEAMGRRGYAGASITPIQPGVSIAGSAITVLAAPGDNLMIHAAIELAEPGDVLVVVPMAESPHGFIGDLMATQMQARGVVGYVTSGGVRDVAELREAGFPVWTRHISSEGTVKCSPGSVNIPIVLGNAIVQPGDVIVADDDGVAVVPRGQARSVLDAAVARVEREAEDRAAYAAGESSLDRKQLRNVIESLGIVTTTQADFAADRESGGASR